MDNVSQGSAEWHQMRLGKVTASRVADVIAKTQKGYSATRAEYQVTRWLSILSTVSTIGRSSANVRVSKDY